MTLNLGKYIYIAICPFEKYKKIKCVEFICILNNIIIYVTYILLNYKSKYVFIIKTDTLHWI